MRLEPETESDLLVLEHAGIIIWFFAAVVVFVHTTRIEGRFVEWVVEQNILTRQSFTSAAGQGYLKVNLQIRKCTFILEKNGSKCGIF